MAATKQTLEHVLRNGGLVRFQWRECRASLVYANNASVPIDGRTYQGFLRRVHSRAANYTKTETGTVDDGTLIIERCVEARGALIMLTIPSKLSLLLTA